MLLASLVALLAAHAPAHGHGDGHGVDADADDPIVRALRVGARDDSVARDPARGTDPERAPSTAARLGAWSPVVDWPVLAVHAALLPTGRVLAWDATPDDFDDDPHTTENYTTRVTSWDPASGTHAATYNDTDTDLFCAGSALLWDGRVLFAGGDSGRAGKNGPLSNSNLYDPWTNRWSRTDQLAAPRWYSSVAALGNGEMLTLGGTYSPTPIAEVFQFNKQWRPLPISTPFTLSGDYSWLQATSDGDVMYFGPHDRLSRLDTDDDGEWTIGPARDAVGYRGYGSYAMYDVDRVLIAGGGDSLASSVTVDTRHSSATPSGAMRHGRRQHNLTILADGTVMASGGNSSGAEQVDPEAGVLEAERWDPATGEWTPLAAAARDRQYHSIALLLPDGRVLSAGGGYCPDCSVHGYHEQNAEIFSPPYLFAADGSPAARPTITVAPDLVDYGAPFTVATPQASGIARVHLIRLGSVTHSQNQSQRLVPLAFADAGETLLVDAPPTRHVAPPGHYLLILVDEAGVPSVGHVLQVGQPLIRADEVVVNRLQAGRTDYYAIEGRGTHTLGVDVRGTSDVVIGRGAMPRPGDGRDLARCEMTSGQTAATFCEVSATGDETWYVGVSGESGTDYTLLAHLRPFDPSLGDDGANAIAAPAITFAQAIDPTAIELYWYTADVREALGYEIYRDGHLVNYRTDRRHVERSLVPGTSYRFEVVATDREHHRSAPSGAVIVTTPPDTRDYDAYYNPRIPSTPVGLRHTRYSSEAMELFWSASRDDRTVIGYEVHRDGQLLDFVDGPSYFEGSLTPGHDYRYSVVAVDSDRNRSAPSAEIVIRLGDVGPTPTGETGDTIDVDGPGGPGGGREDGEEDGGRDPPDVTPSAGTVDEAPLDAPAAPPPGASAGIPTRSGGGVGGPLVLLALTCLAARRRDASSARARRGVGRP